jgi:hypothetical protein
LQAVASEKKARHLNGLRVLTSVRGILNAVRKTAYNEGEQKKTTNELKEESEVI